MSGCVKECTENIQHAVGCANWVDTSWININRLEALSKDARMSCCWGPMGIPTLPPVPICRPHIFVSRDEYAKLRSKPKTWKPFSQRLDAETFDSWK